VIHKKPLIFLHWYHRITVLLYCWHSYVTKSSRGIILLCHELCCPLCHVWISLAFLTDCRCHLFAK
jgi:hypothetical protein